MKNSMFTFILIPVLYSCSSDIPKEFENTDLIGKWKLSEAYISAGGPQDWVAVEDGEELVLFENGTFTSSRYSECTTGTWSTEQIGLILDYNCEGFESESENEDGLITYNLKFESGYFIATPTSGPICIEGCSYKYLKK